MSKEEKGPGTVEAAAEANTDVNQLDKDTIKIEFIGELLVNGSLTIDQLVDGYKAQVLTRSFIVGLINEMLSRGDIELIQNANPKESCLSTMKNVFDNPTLHSEKSIDPVWEEIQALVLKRDHYLCRMCGDTNSLNVYPLGYHKGDPIHTPVDELITLCKYCRNQVEKMLIDGIEPVYFVKP